MVETAFLTVVLQPPWQRVEVSRLLEAFLSGQVDEALRAQLGEDLAQQVHARLSGVREICEADGLALAAVRMRAASAIDFLTVAVPPGRQQGAEEATWDAPGGGQSGEVEPQREIFRSHVQLVRRVSPANWGAIVTLCSSEEGAEEVLSADAGLIAQTLRLDHAADHDGNPHGCSERA